MLFDISKQVLLKHACLDSGCSAGAMVPCINGRHTQKPQPFLSWASSVRQCHSHVVHAVHSRRRHSHNLCPRLQTLSQKSCLVDSLGRNTSAKAPCRRAHLQERELDEIAQVLRPPLSSHNEQNQHDLSKHMLDHRIKNYTMLSPSFLSYF